MGIEDELAGLIDRAYFSAYEPERWDGWAEQVGRLLGGHSTTFYVVDAHTGAVLHNAIHHPDPRVPERYMDEGVAALDPQHAHVMRLQTSKIYSDVDHLDLANDDVREYVDWARSNANLRHYITASAILGGGSHIGGISVHRAVADGVTPSEDKRLMAALFPDFSRALQLGFLHAEKLSMAYWEGVLTERSEPALLIDERGRFLRGGPAVERIFAAADGLDVRGGQLHACDAASQDRLDALLKRGVSRACPTGGSVSVGRLSGRAPYLITAIPLPRAIRMLAPFGAAALVTIVDPTARIPTHTDRWRKAFGLTAREVELAALLMQGHSVDSAAHVLGIVTGTARLHLRHALVKTGVSRQADMIRLLARL